MKVIVLSLLAILLSGTVYAAVITDSETISLASTNWGQAIYLEKFHGNIADLQSVVITLEATGTGDIWAENLANKAADIQLNWAETVTMKKSGSTLLTAAPSYTDTHTWAAFDGTFDWDGASGDKYAGLTDTKTSSMTLTSGFGDYVGAGTFQLDVLADAISWTIGTGNVASYYQTEAGAKATITYNYVPEPGSWIALLTGCVGLIGVGTRRRSK